MKSIILIADYFGAWPEWFPVFLASCEANPTISWLIHTDCVPPDPSPSNVMFQVSSRSEYCARISQTLGIAFNPQSMYNIANLRPAFGELFADDIAGHDYFGWCDIDLVFGDLRRFLTPAVMQKNIITMSSEICTGHLTLVKNEPAYREMYKHIPDWSRRMGVVEIPPWDESVDEAWLSRLCSPSRNFRDQGLAAGIPHAVIDRYRANNHFQEQWVTPFIPYPWLDGDLLHPEVWYWRPGSLTNWRDGARQFPYLHFMNLKAPRYIDSHLYGLTPTWSQFERILSPDVMVADTVRIDRCGITGVSQADADAERRRLHAFADGGRLIPASGRSSAELLAEARHRGVDGYDNGQFVDPAGVLSAALRGALAVEAGLAL